VRPRKRLAFLGGMQDLLAAHFWIDIRSWILAAAVAAGMTAILLFAIGGMPVAYQGLASTVRTVKDDGDH